jgi:Ran GTPase-activating protein (RanGAP) involved in mRNA processing and transport
MKPTQTLQEPETLDYLESANLTSPEIQNLATALTSGRNITHLYLGGSLNDRDFSFTDFQIFAKSLSENTTLEVLDLESCNIDPVRTVMLTLALATHPKLRILNLAGNKITDVAAEEIANLIAHNEVISKLVLERNHIGNEGARNLLTAAKDRTSLGIKLKGNPITDKSILKEYKASRSSKTQGGESEKSISHSDSARST